MGRQIRTYIIQDTATGLCKIGSAVNPAHRMKTLQTGCPGELKLVLVLDTDCEVQLHTRFKDARVRGEWFKVTAALRQFVMTEQGRQRQTAIKLVLTESPVVQRVVTAQQALPASEKQRDLVEAFYGVRYLESRKELTVEGNWPESATSQFLDEFIDWDDADNKRAPDCEKDCMCDVCLVRIVLDELTETIKPFALWGGDGRLLCAVDASRAISRWMLERMKVAIQYADALGLTVYFLLFRSGELCDCVGMLELMDISELFAVRGLSVNAYVPDATKLVFRRTEEPGADSCKDAIKAQIGIQHAAPISQEREVAAVKAAKLLVLHMDRNPNERSIEVAYGNEPADSPP